MHNVNTTNVPTYPYTSSTQSGSISGPVVERTRLEILEERLAKHTMSLRDVTERFGQALDRLRGSQPPSVGSANKRAVEANRLGALDGIIDEADALTEVLHGFAQDLQRIA